MKKTSLISGLKKMAAGAFAFLMAAGLMVGAQAAPAGTGSLSVKECAADAYFTLYRVADMTDDGFVERKELTADYEKVDLTDLSSDSANMQTAAQLKSLVDLTGLKPVAEDVAVGKSSGSDKAALIAKDLQPGLYLITGRAQGDSGFTMKDFLASVPYKEANGSWTYDLVIDATKFSKEVEKKSHSYRITKVWNEEDDDDSARPSKITITILKDSKFWKDVDLSDDNDWTYVIDKETAGTSNFAVAEKKNKDSNYTQSNWKSSSGKDDQITITCTNTKPSPGKKKITTTVVKTGDPTDMNLMVAIFAFSGLVLILLGLIAARRKKRQEEK